MTNLLIDRKKNPILGFLGHLTFLVIASLPLLACSSETKLIKPVVIDEPETEAITAEPTEMNASPTADAQTLDINGSNNSLASESDLEQAVIKLIEKEFTFAKSGEGVGIQLNSIQINSHAVQIGQSVTVDIELQALKSITTRYNIFTSLTDETGLGIADADFEAQDGERPTDSWQAGEVIVIQLNLVIPTNRFTQPGNLTLKIGMYDVSGASDHILLDREHQLAIGTISIVGPAPTQVPIPPDQEAIRETNYGVTKEILEITATEERTIILIRVFIDSRWGMTADPLNALPHNAIMHSLEFPRLFDQNGHEYRGSGSSGGQWWSVVVSCLRTPMVASQLIFNWLFNPCCLKRPTSSLELMLTSLVCVPVSRWSLI